MSNPRDISSDELPGLVERIVKKAERRYNCFGDGIFIEFDDGTTLYVSFPRGDGVIELKKGDDVLMEVRE